MSLEQAITDHASALRELAAAIRGTISTANGITAATDQVIGAAKSAAAATTTTKEATSTTQVAETKKPAEQPKPEAAAGAPAPDYEAVKAKVLAVSKDKGRDQVVALLQRHGVDKAPELKPEQYAAVIADADAIMAGTFDAIAGELA